MGCERLARRRFPEKGFNVQLFDTEVSGADLLRFLPGFKRDHDGSEPEAVAKFLREWADKLDPPDDPISRFRKPDVFDVAKFASENGLAIDAQEFVDFYQSKDWFVGRNKMKDWRAAARRWARRNANGGQNRLQGGGSVARVASIERVEGYDEDHTDERFVDNAATDSGRL